jgi:GDP-D-mannose dehydratase
VFRKFNKCLITGISGAGGSYLAEYIISNNSKIKLFGFYRSKGYKNILKKKYKNRITLFKVDLNDFRKIKFLSLLVY